MHVMMVLRPELEQKVLSALKVFAEQRDITTKKSTTRKFVGTNP